MSEMAMFRQLSSLLDAEIEWGWAKTEATIPVGCPTVGAILRFLVGPEQ